MAYKVRVRFAPSPTGYLHLGNMRAALLNFLFAKQKDGTLVLRVEDTDQERNIELGVTALLDDLRWLGITFNEGPHIAASPYAPYEQSKRTQLYKQHLDDLIGFEKVYRCFCTPEMLEADREQQRAKGLPPRYGRRCLQLSGEQRDQKLEQGQPFVWRFKINTDQVVQIHDMARGAVKFEMKNFGDFVLARSNGTFTFTFTNFIDDWLMKITHVIRGEDHLTNSALQAALYDALAVSLPIFWHLPILCNLEGKKLSKRDFGFALRDLKAAGFLPEAIVNYLAFIGSGTIQGNEIQTLQSLAQHYDFSHINSTGQIKYDLEKLRWFNHQWITTLTPEQLAERVRPFLQASFPHAEKCAPAILSRLIQGVVSELIQLDQIPELLSFYFVVSEPSRDMINENVVQDSQVVLDVLCACLSEKDGTSYLAAVKTSAKERGIKLRSVLGTLRYLLTGTYQGIGINDLVAMLDEEFMVRVSTALEKLK